MVYGSTDKTFNFRILLQGDTPYYEEGWKRSGHDGENHLI